jgi:Flp pilus assembly protein TadG
VCNRLLPEYLEQEKNTFKMAHVTRAYGQWRPSWKNTSSNEATAAVLTGNTVTQKIKSYQLTRLVPNSLRNLTNLELTPTGHDHNLVINMSPTAWLGSLSLRRGL